MKIVIHDFGRHAFPVQLSRSLASKGHSISHWFAGSNNTPLADFDAGEIDSSNLRFKPIYLDQPYQKYSLVKRYFQEVEYGRKVAHLISQEKPDLLLIGTTPLDSLWEIIKACKKQNIRFVFWLQDFFGIASYSVLKKRIPLLGSLIGLYHLHLEKKLLLNSDHVIAITDDFIPILKNWNVNISKISMIPNWAPLDDYPVLSKNNSWACENDLNDKFNFLYSGSLGLKHNPDYIIKLALRFIDQSNVRIIVISEGLGRIWLEKRKQELKLKNLILMDYQPYKRMPEVLSSSDVLIALLEKNAGVFSVPSKILAYLCAQRPILMSGPSENRAAKIVSENDTGTVTEPGDLNGFLHCADYLYHDKSKRELAGVNARKYAEKHFIIEDISSKFEKIFNDLQ